MVKAKPEPADDEVVEAVEEVKSEEPARPAGVRSVVRGGDKPQRSVVRT